MRKFLIPMITFCLLFTTLLVPLQAAQKDTKQILVNIKGAENLYLISLKGKTMKVKTISNQLYTKISCLDNEYSTLKSVDFTSSYTCLSNSMSKTLNTKIDNYVIINMPAILKEVGLNENEYDYQSLDSLTSVAKKILNNFKLSMIAHYSDFIETDLSVNDLYELYQFYHKEKFTTKYYYLNYIVMNDKFFLLDASFHLKK